VAARKKLEVIMGFDSGKFSAGMREVANDTRKLDRAASASSRTTQRLGGALKSAAFAAAGAAAAYVSVAQAKAAITTTQELALATMGLRRNLGFATEEASRWAAVTRARGIDSKALTMGFTTLSRNIEGVKIGTEASVDAFKALGVTQKDLASTGGDFSKQVVLLADAFGNAEGSTKRQAAAQKLLGRGYQTILPMFAEGSKGLKEQLKWADQFGATMGEDTVDAMDAYTAAQRRSKVAMMGLQITFAKHFTPVVTDALDEFGKFVSVLNSDDLSADQKMAKLRNQFTRLSDDIMKVASDLMPIIAQRGGEMGVQLAKGIANGFMNTGLLGKAFLTTMLLKSLGGWGAVSVLGATFGNKFGTAAGGAAGGSMKAGLLGTLKSGLMTAGAGISIVAALDAYKVFVEKDAKDVTSRLDQIEGKGRTVQRVMGDLFSTVNIPVFSQAAGVLGLDKLGGQADAAKSLKRALGEIATADRERFGTLKRVIAGRAQELNLTVEQRKELDKIVRASAVGAQNTARQSLSRGNGRLASGFFVGSDIQKVTNDQLALVSKAYAKYTPGWRRAVAETLDAQAAAVRKGWTRNGKLTREGLERIKAIQERRKDMLAGADPIGIGKGIINGWRKARRANEINMKGMVSRLQSLPPKARAQAAQTMLTYARELQAKGKLPEGTMKTLRSRLLAQFGTKLWKDMKDSTRGGFLDITSAFRKGTNDAEGEMRKFETKVRGHSRKVKTAVTGIPGPVRTAYETLATYSNQAAAAFGSQKTVALAFRGGGETPFVNRGNMVPAMVSPGERVDHRGKSWTVPGKRTAADSVFALLPQRAAVLTDHGQQLMAAGASRKEALRKQLPHFSSGGTVDYAASTPRPTLTGGAAVSTSTGQAGIDATRKAAVAWLKRLVPGRIMKMIEYGDRITSRGLPYQYGGGHGELGVGTPSFDCSGFVSGILGAGGFISAPMTVAQGTGLYTLGKAGEGQYHEWGVRGTSGANAHTMIRVEAGGKGGYYEAGGDGVIKRGGWNGSFSPRHMPGYGKGGTVIQGKTSWFSPADAPNTTADGKHTAADPGFAIRSYDTLGDWWWAEVGGAKGMLQHIDWGPAAWTGRAVDFTKAGLDKIGASHNITDTQAKITWLGGDVDRATETAKELGFLGKKQKPKLTPKQKRAQKRSRRRATRTLGYAEDVQDEAKNSKLAGRAVKAAKKAVSLAKAGEFGKANKWTKKARALATKAASTIPGLKPKRPPFAAGKFDKNDPFSPTNLPGFKLLPEPVKRMLMAPGLSWQGRRNIADMALGMAGTTATKKDDAAALNMILGLEKGRRRKAQKQYRRASGILAKGGLTKKQRTKWQRIQANALDTITTSTGEINTARGDIRDLNESDGDGGSGTDMAEAMKELAEAIKEQNRLQSGVQAVGSREALRMLSDVISGEIVGKRAAPVNSYPGVRY
jgi:hypothetical protein